MNLQEFLKQFGITKEIQTTKIGNTLYKNPQLLQHRPVFSGEPTAYQKGETLTPSNNLLQYIAKHAKKHVIVNPKAEWLYICGRDIFAKGITQHNNPEINDFVVILNQYKECIGYGQVIAPLDTQKIAIKRLYDIGDLLRRERVSKKVKF